MSLARRGLLIGMLASCTCAGGFARWAAASRGAAFALPEGTLADTAWARCGAPVSSGPGDRTGVVTLSDGSRGLYVVWQRVNSVSTHSDLWAQHLDADGHVVSGWGTNGLALCTAPGDQKDEVAIPDGVGGFTVAWSDDRNDSTGHSNPDIFALRVG